MKSTRLLLALGFVAVLLVSTLPTAAADVIHLRTGEAVKGRPIEQRSDDNFLTVEDFLTGAIRRFSWNAVDPADRARIQQDWDWTKTGESTIVGVRVTLRLGDGSTTEVRGKVVREDESTLVIVTDGREVEIDKSRIADREDEELDVREVWTPEQLVDRYKETQKTNKGVDYEDEANVQPRDWFALGTHAEWVGAYAVAKYAYQKAAEDEEFLKKDVAEQRLARVEALLQDAAALATIKDAKHKLRMSLFRKVRAMLEGFPEKHPSASEAVLQKLESLRVRFENYRTQELQILARRNFVDIAKDLIHDKVKEDDIAITDVTSWTRRELPEVAFATLAGVALDEEGNPVIDEDGKPVGTKRYLNKYDDVTPEEAKALWEGRWEGRRRGSWKKITYGDGTFIVQPPKIKPPKSRRGARSSRGRGGGGGGGKIEIPKPPTRDQWWERASTRERESWVLSYFVERSELFELGDPEFRPCAMCHGVGLLSKVLQTGDTYSYLCTQCGGAQQDKIVKYR